MGSTEIRSIEEGLMGLLIVDECLLRKEWKRLQIDRRNET